LTENGVGTTGLWSKLRSTIHMPQESKWDLDTSTRWIKQQLLHCDKNHPDCKSDHEEPSILPTRVLDLGENPRDTSIHLHQTNNSFGVYATLSHCWGLVQPLTTTQDTYPQRLEGIALTELPNTFRDAVLVTRKLGIRYLWIDSLCIIQGDKTDWEMESSRMAGVYSNAYVNLAASSSRDCRGGLFRDGRARYLEIRREDEGSINYQVFVRLGLEAGHRSCLHIWAHSLSTPLLDRAWVYQERVLSKRFVQFTNSELVWECNTSITCECGNPLLKHCTFPALIRPNFNTPDDPSFLKAWDDVLGFYTRLNLTEEEDRLPALSGVAVAIQSKSNQTYYAGMWKEQMPQNLLWAYFTKGDYSRSYIAPTWSWASSRGAVHGNAFYKGNFYPDPRFKVLHISCDFVGKNPHGRVQTGAHMKVESGRLRYGALTLGTAASAHEFKIIWVYPELHMELRNFKADHNGEGRVGGDEAGKYDGREVNNWVFLVVGFGKPLSDLEEIEVALLVLKPSKVGSGSFIRIGVARISVNKDIATALQQNTRVEEFCIY
jgi:Heterokaryon incompatibility protein (HET)